MKRKASMCLVALLAAALVADAEMVTRRLGSPPKGPAKVVTGPKAKPPTAYVPEAKTPPKMDGTLEEAEWQGAASVSLARTLDGLNRAGQATEVRLLRDTGNLYLGIRCAEPLLDKLRGSRRGHDGEIWSDDSIEVFLGVKGGPTYYHLGINSFGSTYDGQAKDKAWDSGMKAAAAKGKGEWTLEVAIPLEKMAGRGKAPKEWIANFNRNRYVTGNLEEFAWSPTFSDNSHEPGMFGNLIFDQPPGAEATAPEVKPVEKESLTISPAEGGEGIARFDLSFLPKGAKIYRADLWMYRTTAVDGQLDEARIDVEVYPLLAAPAAGREPKVEGKPLAVRPPWFDCLDATEAVQQWASGKTNAGFYVKACPFWNREGTCLDIAYEAQPPTNLPPQVTGVAAFHKAGQTFITWREIEQLVGTDPITWGPLKLILDDVDARRQVRYVVYRHDKPITVKNLPQAEVIATVKPLSGWNLNGRNIERPIDIYIATQDVLMTGQWNPFGRARLDGDFGRDCPMDRLVIREGDKPLPNGTGLYVHSPAAKGKAYYAVVACIDGVQNTIDISEKNSPKDPVDESPGEGEPVLQGEMPKMPFFNYNDRRLHYVVWRAPPCVNLPSQYYNWSVGVPNALGKDVPLELSLPRDGDSYWRTQYRIEYDSIVLCPYDFPFSTWWYGYHESYGTLKSFDVGTVQPYTERRLLAFVKWAAKKWPVDPNRVLVTGSRGGASAGGALQLGLRHPEVFCLVIAGHAEPDYLQAATAAGRQRGSEWVAQTMQAIWGKPEWKLRTSDGKVAWDEHDMTKLVAGAPPGQDLPLVTLTSNNGPTVREFHKAMLEGGRALVAEFQWGGGRYIPISRTHTSPNTIRLDVALNRPVLAFRTVAATDSIAKGGMGEFNREFRWRSDDLKDQPDGFEVSISGTSAGGVDLTVRRLQKFKVQKGKAYHYVNTGPAKPDPRNPTAPAVEKQEGEVVIGDDGLLTIKGLKAYPANGRLVVTPQ